MCDSHRVRYENELLSLLRKVDVAFLQASYLSDNEHVKLNRHWVGQVYFSSNKTHSRGTVVLTHKTSPFRLEKSVTDPNGRFVLISGSFYGTLITFLNIYAPIQMNQRSCRTWCCSSMKKDLE